MTEGIHDTLLDGIALFTAGVVVYAAGARHNMFEATILFRPFSDCVSATDSAPSIRIDRHQVNFAAVMGCGMVKHVIGRTFDISRRALCRKKSIMPTAHIRLI